MRIKRLNSIYSNSFDLGLYETMWIIYSKYYTNPLSFEKWYMMWLDVKMVYRV